jgi:hypothetical protein
MMDFRIKHENSTSFSYVLPVNSREALVEFTLFTKYLLPENDYDPYIKEYISTYISKEEYSIKEVEFGVIPMSILRKICSKINRKHKGRKKARQKLNQLQISILRYPAVRYSVWKE